MGKKAEFPLARRLRSPDGAPLGAVFAFLSGLYFRAKLAYAQHFARVQGGGFGVFLITPCDGLCLPTEPVDLHRLRRYSTPIVETDARYSKPLLRDSRTLARALDSGCEVVFLGSIATGRYLPILHRVFGTSLRYPAEFLGRGSMSRGSLLLRCVKAGSELHYRGVDKGGSRPSSGEREVRVIRAIRDRDRHLR